MSPSHVDVVVPHEPLSALPVRLEQRSDRIATLAALAGLVLVGIALAIPYAAVVRHLIEEPSARQLVLDQPARVLQLGLGFAVAMALVCWPASRLAVRLVRRRVVTVSPGWVESEDTGLAGARAWREPLANYEGIVHHVRASLSGVRHEVILVHPLPERSILLALAPRFAEGDVARICDLLGLPEIPARRLYRTVVSQDSAPPPQLHAARA